MKKIKTSSIMMMLLVLVLACTNDTDQTGNSPTPIGIGQLQVSNSIEISQRHVAAAPFAEDDLLTVLAQPNNQTNTYLYTAEGTWVQQSPAGYYLDDVLDPATSFHATKGTESLVTDQTQLKDYRAADYIAGLLKLDTDARQLVTAVGEPLTHQHVDVVLTLSRGTGWTDDDHFASTIAAADIKLYTTDGTTVSPYGTGAGNVPVRAILPVDDLPAQGSRIATIALNGETSQPITYTLPPGSIVPTAGTRLNIAAEYHNHRGLGAITITVTGWTDMDMPGLTTNIKGYDLIIATKADLETFRDRVNAGENELRALQIADIDLAGEEWVPIGNYDNTPDTYRFLGTYNGNGHTIKNMTIEEDYTNAGAGLFGRVGPGAILAGIRLESVNIDCTASYGAGALAGKAYGDPNQPIVISHCTAQGTVINTSFAAGGLTGVASDTHMAHCHTQCTVNARFPEAYAGGLTGSTSSATLVACSATGTGQISANSEGNYAYAGGLTGRDTGSTIAFCRATQTANASGYDNTRAGGFIGNNNITTISGCYATGGATATGYGSNDQGTFAGHIYQNTIITHCHATKGDGDAVNTVGYNYNSAEPDIATDTGSRYATITADKTFTVKAYTITRKPGTGEILLPPYPHEFKAADVWTNEEFPQIIDNQ